MFGYVTIDKPELKIKEFELYRSFYCGLCRELRDRHGIPGQISLTYDMTFVVMLLSSLYELPVQKGTTRCIIHPVLRQTVRRTTATEYGADMNVLLAYYKCQDDWADDKDVLKKSYSVLLKAGVKKVEKLYPQKAEAIRFRLRQISEAEKTGSTDPDLCAGIFGRLLEEIIIWKDDEWTAPLRQLAFYLGKYIYLVDAWEDVSKDIRTGNYNVFKTRAEEPDFDKYIENLLTLMLSEACKGFEHLPLLRFEDILRNILYSGVWTRYRHHLHKDQV